MDAESEKRKVVEKYEREAKNLDSDQWYSRGGSARVPEGKAAHYFIERKVTEALKLLDPETPRTADVLEIGCSFGHMTPLLAGRFAALTSLDISPTSVAIASKRLDRYGIKNVRFLVDDAEKLEHIPDAGCDVVFSFSTIRFCPDQEKALRAIRSKLRPGAVAIIDFPNPLSPWHVFIKAVLRIKRHVNDNLYSEKELIEKFTLCGYQVEKTKVYLFTTKRLPALLLPVFRALDFILERTPGARRLGGIVMIKARRA